MKVLKQDCKAAQELEELMDLLNEKGFKIHSTTYRGLIVEKNGKFFRPFDGESDEGIDCFPPFYEVRFELVNCYGNSLDEQ